MTFSHIDILTAQSLSSLLYDENIHKFSRKVYKEGIVYLFYFQNMKFDIHHNERVGLSI